VDKGLLRFTIKNFRGLAELEAAPNGKSVTLRGRNGSGKTSAIDALWWGLGGALEGEVVRNGAAAARVEIELDGYRITRSQTRGKRPTLTVASADGKAKYSSPTALLSGFVGALERRAFSSRTAKDRAAVLRQLAPGLDCGDLDAERGRVYEERTGVNRDARTLRAQAEGVVVPPMPEGATREEQEIDVAAIAGRKAEVERQRAANEKQRERARAGRLQAKQAQADVDALHREIEAMMERHKAAQERADRIADLAQKDEAAAAALVDPDATAIDADIAAAREHNRRVAAARRMVEDRARAQAERERLDKQAAQREEAVFRLTERIQAIDAEKASRLAAASLPIPGIALAGEVVTFDDGRAGPVELEALNTASRTRLDIAIAAALGHRLIAVRDASLLDDESRADVAAFAAERGVQLLAEVVSSGESLTAEIVEGAAGEPAGEALEADF